MGVTSRTSHGLEVQRMAALTATPPKQDVAFSPFQREEESVEELSDVTDNTKDIKEDSKGDDRDDARKESKSSVTGGGGGKFTLGIEDGSEFMEEVAFSLQHHPLPPGEGQPPPGHWVSQPHGKNIECYMWFSFQNSSDIFSGSLCIYWRR